MAQSFATALDPTAVLLLWLRLLPVCVLLPSAAMRRVVVAGPGFVAGLLSVCLVALLAPAPASTGLVPAAARELLVGAAFALSAGAPLLALAWFGHVLDLLVAPGQRSEAGALSRLYGAFGLALFFALGGHRLLLAALVGLLGRVPLGAEAAQFDAGRVGAMAGSLAQALAWTLVWAAPFAGALVGFDLIAGLIARYLDRASFAAAAAPLRTLCGLVLLLLGGAFVADLFPDVVAAAADSARGVGAP